MRNSKNLNLIRMLDRLHKKTSKRIKRYGKITDEEINEIVQKHRHIRKSLKELTWRADAKKTIDELTILIKKDVKPSKAGFAVKSIREDRDHVH